MKEYICGVIVTDQSSNQALMQVKNIKINNYLL